MRTLCRMGVALALATAMGYWFVPGAPWVKTHKSGRAGIYNTATETSVRGTLAQPPARGRMGLHLSVEQSSGEMVDVRLAPQGYLEARGFSIEAGDELEVTGSRVTMYGAPVLIAREVTKQGRTVPLRDATGRPLWR